MWRAAALCLLPALFRDDIRRPVGCVTQVHQYDAFADVLEGLESFIVADLVAVMARVCTWTPCLMQCGGEHTQEFRA